MHEVEKYPRLPQRSSFPHTFLAALMTNPEAARRTLTVGQMKTPYGRDDEIWERSRRQARHLAVAPHPISNGGFLGGGSTAPRKFQAEC